MRPQSRASVASLPTTGPQFVLNSPKTRPLVAPRSACSFCRSASFVCLCLCLLLSLLSGRLTALCSNLKRPQPPRHKRQACVQLALVKLAKLAARLWRLSRSLARSSCSSSRLAARRLITLRLLSISRTGGQWCALWPPASSVHGQQRQQNNTSQQTQVAARVALARRSR